jgi:hypothetical protein
MSDLSPRPSPSSSSPPVSLPLRRSRLFAAMLGAVVVMLVTAGGSVDRAAAGTAGGQRPADPAASADPVVRAVNGLTRSATWSVAREIPLAFATYHPQGLARVGDRLYLSSVEVIDRPAGKGRGHLFELDLSGRLLRQIQLGEGPIYHPGGIDYDGRHLWVPVGEYFPDSSSIVYRVDPATLRASEAFRVADHVGGVVRDPASGLLHGVTWGSRRTYTWTTRGTMVRHGDNESHYVDFQDCAAAGAGQAVCTGLTEYPTGPGTRFDLGGIAVVDLRGGAVRHEVPVTVLSANRHVVTRNPVHLEVSGERLRMWAAPDDAEEPGGTRLLVLETPVPGTGG